MTDALTASDERGLYSRDRAAWLAYVAPRLAAYLNISPAISVCVEWRCLDRDYQLAPWPHLNAASQAAVRATETTP